MNATERIELLKFLDDMEEHYITKPRQNGQPVDKHDLWCWLQASLTAGVLEALGDLSDQLTDLSTDVDDPLKKLAADVTQIKLNTCPD